MLKKKNVNGFILGKYCRWSHTHERRGFIFVFTVHLCDICRRFCGKCFCRLLMIMSLFNDQLSLMSSWHFIISLSMYFCKVYIQVMVMSPSRALFSLSLSSCHSGNTVLNLFPHNGPLHSIKICRLNIVVVVVVLST